MCIDQNALQIEFQGGTVYIDTQLNNPCKSINAIYFTQSPLLLTDILFSVFFARILLTKTLFWRLYFN